MTPAGVVAVFALAVSLTAASAFAAPPDAASALDALRQQCVAAARDEQTQETAYRELQHQIDLLAADEAGRRRDLADSRPEQEHLLGVLLFLARTRDDPLAAVAEPPLDRRRGELLIAAVAPELRAEAEALMREIAEAAKLPDEIAARQRELGASRAALAQKLGQLGQLVAQRQAVLRQLMPKAAGDQSDLAAAAVSVNDVGDLIKQADAAADRRDRARARAAPPGADPGRPPTLRAFDPPHSKLLLPVAGTISQRFGEPDAAGELSHGLEIAAMPGAEVIAPFDGRVVFAGAFRGLGLLLILRHGALYHSQLSGLGRVDVIADQWVLAGEPVGAMPGVAANGASPQNQQASAPGSVLGFEMRQGGQPVDPQPWLDLGATAGGPASREQGVRQ
jgi:murein hydrolase activator